jgi:hypothetical protein
MCRCVACDLKIVLSGPVLESRATIKGRFLWEETVRVSINTQLLKIELVISVDQKHGTKIATLSGATATHPVTQVGCTSMTFIVDRRKNVAPIIIVCVEHDMKTNRAILPFAS